MCKVTGVTEVTGGLKGGDAVILWEGVFPYVQHLSDGFWHFLHKYIMFLLICYPVLPRVTP
jgi:hypothetical protein